MSVRIAAMFANNALLRVNQAPMSARKALMSANKTPLLANIAPMSVCKAPLSASKAPLQIGKKRYLTWKSLIQSIRPALNLQFFIDIVNMATHRSFVNI
jgi:hypothetical protein